jgi:hypothetical protein
MTSQMNLLDQKLASLQATPKGFMVSVERVVNLGNYESIRVGLAETHESNGSVTADDIFEAVLAKVESWTSTMKPKESVTVGTNQVVSPRPAVSKLASLQERLGARLQDLEVTDGMDGIVVRPRKYLGEVWSEVNEVARSLCEISTSSEPTLMNTLY